MNGQDLKQAVISGSNNICSKKLMINDLNIFPVPDGDTGTNMSMTTTAAVNAIKDEESTEAGVIAKAVASAMLRGARGNSGVILSLLFRGFSQGLSDKEEITGKDVVKALGLGVDAAYSAVMKPTEGTILTVARVGYEGGLKVVNKNDDLVYVWEEICKAAEGALEKTPEYLPVLKKAGVVDAGGMGLLSIFEGMLSYFKDGIVVEYEEDNTQEELDNFTSTVAEFDEVINFTYCTEFIVGRDTEIGTDPNELRLFLETIGDCVVVVNDEEIIKVHVHTEQPGDALKKGLEYGQLLTVKVENMREQHKKAKEDNAAAKSKKAPVKKQKLEPVEPTEEIGFVAVAAGEGLTNLFKDLGCANVVSGGQSMNPSTDDIYEAVMATPAKTVIVLPNNKNIIMAAQQTVPMVEDREVIIVPTRTIPQGMTAILNYDPELSPESNKDMMMDAAKAVATGQVTFAARNSEFGHHKIKEGEIIALENGKLTITEKTPVKAAVKLAKNMINHDTSFVTLIYGDDVSEEDAQEAYEIIQDKYGSKVDVSLVNGGQPIYYFILSVE
ncbi:MAG: DAK2 domain-containing protein [Ruminococcus sp.]|nr:DAK2 domain-containing protein [Ruminococcus sp.]